MAEFTEIVHEKCMAFADRIVKLNDYLLQMESKKEAERSKREEGRCKSNGSRNPLVEENKHVNQYQ